MTQIYTIESIRNRDGSVHERELRRKGHRVKIEDFIGLIITYIDEADAYLRTSPVESDVIDGELRIVTTRNTVYTFKEAV